ncbi:MAG: hypothetical protein KC561_04055 [Myxococcales bacterium]|nr:hypothetical protein [Myxococcales bacterium]
MATRLFTLVFIGLLLAGCPSDSPDGSNVPQDTADDSDSISGADSQQGEDESTADTGESDSSQSDDVSGDDTQNNDAGAGDTQSNDTGGDDAATENDIIAGGDATDAAAGEDHSLTTDLGGDDQTSRADGTNDLTSDAVEATTIVGSATCGDSVVIGEGYYRIAVDGLTNDIGRIGTSAASGQCSTLTNSGVDTTFAIDIPAHTALRVQATASSENIFLVTVDDCENVESDVCQVWGKGIASELNSGDSPIRRLLVVDSTEALSGSIDLQVELIAEGDLPAGDLCDNPIVLSGLGPHTLAADTDTFINQHSTYAGVTAFAPGADIYYQVSVPDQGRLVVTNAPDNFNYGVLSNCNDPSPSSVRPFLNESTVLNNESGPVLWWFFIDGNGQQSGGFESVSIEIREFDPCTGINCDSYTACEDDELITYSNGTCSGGTCGSGSVAETVECQFGCGNLNSGCPDCSPNYGCLPDPCNELVCDFGCEDGSCFDGVPGGWTCDAGWWFDGGCDCGCGVVDIGCQDGSGNRGPSADACGFCFSDCAAGNCDLIAEDNNAVCQ